MEEDEDEHHTSIRGRLLMLVNKIKGQAHRAEEPTEKEQAAPCEQTPVSIRTAVMLLVCWRQMLFFFYRITFFQ